jgi:hypothetical protein
MDFGWVEAMANFSNQDFFSEILASKILIPYLERDPGLGELMETPDHPDVHYFASPAPAKQLLPPLRKRLEGMAAKNLGHNLDATRQFVAFLEEHPESQIYNVTFNAPGQHYGVRCGVVDDRLHVICVLTGAHIPGGMLGETNT